MELGLLFKVTVKPADRFGFVRVEVVDAFGEQVVFQSASVRQAMTKAAGYITTCAIHMVYASGGVEGRNEG
jgi:hypothetical protein